MPPPQQPPAQVEFWQHGWPAAPQATAAPPEQTIPLAPSAAPEATQVPPLQQPPPAQLLPAQHGCPCPPQLGMGVPEQLPFIQTPPFGQPEPLAMHVLPEQQLGAPHMLPGQQI